MLSYIDRAEIPATSDAICTMMMLRHGLTRSKTVQYLRELEVARVIGMNRDGAYKMLQSMERVLAAIASAEPRQT
jgi:hypothetical protein